MNLHNHQSFKNLSISSSLIIILIFFPVKEMLLECQVGIIHDSNRRPACAKMEYLLCVYPGVGGGKYALHLPLSTPLQYSLCSLMTGISWNKVIHVVIVYYLGDLLSCNVLAGITRGGCYYWDGFRAEILKLFYSSTPNAILNFLSTP